MSAFVDDRRSVARVYKPFNMGGQCYYTCNKGDVEFFVLDSNYMDPAQLKWVEQSLRESKAKWKIAYFHHSLYVQKSSPMLGTPGNS